MKPKFEIFEKLDHNVDGIDYHSEIGIMKKNNEILDKMHQMLLQEIEKKNDKSLRDHN